MDHYRTHERARGPLALFGQETGAERDGNEQQGEQRRPCRSYQQVEVVPSLQRIGWPHKQTPVLPQPNTLAMLASMRPDMSGFGVKAEVVGARSKRRF
jgi:hypothetical protein